MHHDHADVRNRTRRRSRIVFSCALVALLVTLVPTSGCMMQLPALARSSHHACSRWALRDRCRCPGMH